MALSNNTLLWRIEGDDLAAPSFLFGTMHVKDQRAFQHRPAVYERIVACSAFATEFDLGTVPLGIDPALLSLPPGESLDRLLGSRHYRKLRHILLKSLQLDIHFFRHQKPLLIANLIDERILSLDMPYALDEDLWRYAREREKRMLGIETYAEQLAILQRIPLDVQLAGLKAIGRNINSHRRQLLQMTRWYVAGDLRQIYRSARRGARGLRHLMLDDRNAVMARRMAAIARQQTCTFAIGAAHLAGYRGLLRLLKKEGFRLRPEPYTI